MNVALCSLAFHPSLIERLSFNFPQTQETGKCPRTQDVCRGQGIGDFRTEKDQEVAQAFCLD